jgi:8-oxo-dGTP pyrophosphatase MutT (NUDIX family)
MSERREYLPNPEMKETQKVVRAFIVQAKSLERVQEEFAQMKDPRDLFLTKVVLAEKSAQSHNNAGQVMPVGGKVDKKDKNALESMLREMLEETHLRPIQMERLEPSLPYTLLTKDGDVSIDQDLYVGEILPSDYAYPLNPEEDKIARFHGLDLKQLGELYGEGSVKNDGSTVTLLGNLRLPLENIQKDTSVNIDPQNQNIPVEIFGELTATLGQKEIVKREKVRKILFDTLNLSEVVKQEWNQKFENTKGIFFEYQNVWSQCLGVLRQEVDFEKHFFASIDLSNFHEEVENVLPRQSQVEAIIRLVYSLLNTQYDFDEYLDVAKQNPKLTEFIEKIEKFLVTFSTTGEKDQSLSQTFSEKVKHIEDFPEELLAHAFCESFNIDESTVAQRLERINKFLASVVDTAINPRVGKTYQKNLVSPISDISGAQLGKLIKYGFSLDKPKWGNRAGQKSESRALKKRMVFEARRSLTLLYLFAKVDAHYSSVMEKGKQPLEELTAGYLSLPIHRAFLLYRENEHDELENIDVFEQKDDAHQISGLVQETKIREFIHPKPETEREVKPSFFVGNEVRTKQMDSVYRKVIVRGSDDPKSIKDIYGRSLTLVPDFRDKNSEKYLITKQKRTLFIDGELREVEDYAPILDIIEYYSHQPNVRVIKFKPTPKDGEKIVSSGVGGGEIRVSKFYVEHTDTKGTVRYEEIQIFAPSEDGRSAAYWEKKKKDDDARYFLDRMLDTKGLRSFIELMFPTTIYGEPIHAMQKDKHFRDGKKRKRSHAKKK